MKKGFVRLRPTDIVDAASEGDIDHIRAILDRYPGQVDIEHNGQTAMQLAAHKGHIDIIKLLASPEYSADVDLCDSDLKTPLHYAVNGNQPTAVELLLNLGAKMEEENLKGETPPQTAFNNKHKDCVKIFLARNKHVCLINKNNVSKTKVGTSAKSQAQAAESPDEKQESKCDGSNSEAADPCFHCGEYQACITYEPCMCKISCFMCSVKNPACKCGTQIDKRSYKDDAQIEALINELKKTKQRVELLSEKDICPICMHRRIDCTLQCGHVFCHQCVRKYPASDNWNYKCYYNCPKPSRYTKVYLPKESEEKGHQ